MFGHPIGVRVHRDRRRRRQAFVLAAAFCVPGLAPGAAAGQSATAAAGEWTVPRTPFGHPDLQGVWVSLSATPLERPESLAGRELLTDEEVADLQRRADRMFDDGGSDFAAGDNLFLAVLGDADRYENPRATCNSLAMLGRQFDNRTSLIVDPPDGRLPPVTAAAERRLAAAAAMEMRPDGPGDLSTWVRCLTRGLPRLGGSSGAGIYSYHQIFQTADHVALVMETIHDARIVPLDGRPHLAGGIRQWLGDSRGRWEGDTLVVETANFSAEATVMGSDRNLRLVERFTRVAEDTIAYEVTITDPTAWRAPWTVRLPLTRTDEPIYEFACHEGNHYGMEGILAGAREQDRADAAASASGRRDDGR